MRFLQRLVSSGFLQIADYPKLNWEVQPGLFFPSWKNIFSFSKAIGHLF